VYHIVWGALEHPTAVSEGGAAVDPATCPVFLCVIHPTATSTTQSCMEAEDLALLVASAVGFYDWTFWTYLSWMDTSVQTVSIWLVIGLEAAAEAEVASTFGLETSQVCRVVVNVYISYKL